MEKKREVSRGKDMIVVEREREREMLRKMGCCITGNNNIINVLDLTFPLPFSS